MAEREFEATTNCPFCGKMNNLYTSLSGNPPEAGDAALCFGCERVGIFTYIAGVLSVRKPTPDEQVELDDFLGLAKIEAVLRKVKGGNR